MFRQERKVTEKAESLEEPKPAEKLGSGPRWTEQQG